MNVFDIIGPIMIGPSSSHTAGAVRLGQIARKILGEDVVQARIELSGSFARTYRGHGTDKALLAGIMGLCPDDTRIRCSPQLAQEKGISFSFLETELPDAHPNTARIHLTGERGKPPRLWGPRLGAVIFWSLRSMVSRSPSRPSAIRCWWSIGIGRGPLLRSPTTRPRRGLTLEIFSFLEPEKGEKPL